jgi:hypothetical protein
MRRILLSLSAGVAACSPSPQEAAMPHPGPLPTTGQTPGNAINQATQGPIVEPRSAAGDSAPAPLGKMDTPAQAAGRRILSTAFVMIGPDRHLTVEQRGGGAIVLRDVVMRVADFCGIQVQGNAAGRPWCGDYADVAAARPGSTPVDKPELGVDGTGVAAEPAHNP